MEQLIIKNLVIFAHHGVNPQEKDMGQKFELDVILDIDLQKACETDDLSDAINYAALCHELTREFTKQAFDLIERAAHVLCMYILENYPTVQKVDLTLKKPWAPILLTIDYPAVRIVRERHVAYIAVGSNMGDRHATIEKALEQINSSMHTTILSKSTLIETAPLGYVSQDDFLNGVFKISTLLSPNQLIQWLMKVEANFNRERLIKWGPRTLDLDVIYYDDLITDDAEIVLPHPRMHERTFVLEPLSEIAPYFVHPLYKKRTLELLADCLNK